MDTYKGYSMLDHIPYDNFDRIESVDANKGTATVVRDMDAVLDCIGIETHIRGQVYRYEKSLTEIPRDMLEAYLKGVKAEIRLLNELANKIEEALAE